MGSKKKSDASGGLLAILGGAVALASAIPKEAWIGLGVVVALLVWAYLHSQAKKQRAAVLARDREKAERKARVGRPVSQRSRPSNPPVEAPAVAAAAMVQPELSDEPIVVVNQLAAQSSFSVPPAPSTYEQGRWVPPGQPAIIKGITIPGGMVYVGTRMRAPSGSAAPCLIDPSLPIADAADYSQSLAGYWPSYSTLSSTARRAYLDWLAGGRQDPIADVGYVFLFFYGLEHRLLVDADRDKEALADWPAMQAELQRLLVIYGPKSGSFRRYASALLDWGGLMQLPSRLYEAPLPELRRNFELPPFLRLALSQAVADRVALPAHLAMAWVKFDPSGGLRSPATRCAAEFERLFRAEYTKAFGTGLFIAPNKTKLKLSYAPASAGFRGAVVRKFAEADLPDVSVLTAPLAKLKAVAEAATAPLEAFSRAIGRNPKANSPLGALLFLPENAWPQGTQDAIAALKGRIRDGMSVTSLQDLQASFGSTEILARDKVCLLAKKLESLALGMEPDVLADARLPKPQDKVVLFALPDAQPLPRTAGPYLAAALMLQLASAVAAADGEFTIKEMSHLRHTVVSWKHLSPCQSRRLLAHLRLLMQAPASLSNLKKRLDPLDQAVKETIAAFMATVAQADGEVNPDEVKTLEKVYKALGVDPKKVFLDVHAVAAGREPAISVVKNVETTRFKLDSARIAQLQQDTDKVSALLAGIFAETDGQPSPPPNEVADDSAEPTPTTTEEQAHGLMGLDDAHSSLARLLLSRQQWARDELQDVAADLDLMLDGALEHINEASFDSFDMPLFEGEDPLTVNAEVLEKIAA